MIKFKQATTLTIINEYDEGTDNIVSEYEHNFNAGEEVDACIFNVSSKDYVDIQFANGSVALGVLRSSFEVIK